MNLVSRTIYDTVESTFRYLCRYHDYEVHGFENIPRSGPALIAFHHSLATYDSFLLSIPIMDRLKRRFLGLADRTIFRTPLLGRVFTDIGFVDGTRQGTIDILRNGDLIGLAPGGMREALRSSQEKYRFDWEDRRGFVWVSMLSGAPIVLAACPYSDDLFDVVANPVTPWIYDRFHFPVPIFRGRGGVFSPIPRPVKLWHVLSEPIYPEVPPDKVQPKDVAHQHQRLVQRMQRLMEESMQLKEGVA